MSEQPTDPDMPPVEATREINWWLLGAGMVMFGIGDFFYFLFALDPPTQSEALGAPGLILLGLTAAVAGVLFAVHRSLSLGVLAGYVAMTITSAGECTWSFGDPLHDGQGAFWALLLYPATVVIVGVVAIVVTIRRRRRKTG